MSRLFLDRPFSLTHRFGGVMPARSPGRTASAVYPPLLGHSTNPSTRHTSGMTLPEMMVAVAVGFLVLMVVNMIFSGSTLCFASMGNYMIMDRASRNALDHMTKDIRNSADLTQFSSSNLVFTYTSGTNLIYTYNSSAGNLTSWKTGDAATNTLLTGITNLTFTLYNNIPLSGGTNATTNVLSQGKAIGVSWKCSKTSAWRTSTENMQEAMIVIRNKPVY
jgi:prepilin-type N-terminal cleavage/methylation domain-containing protein